MSPRLNILFVCGMNQWRSPTAERVYRHDSRVSVRSAGVSAKARHVLSEDDLNWADIVLAMEHKHLSRIQEQFRSRSGMPPMACLEIPDDYTFMDGELIELIRSGTEFHIHALTGA